ncbi:pleckstrin homology domain-containing family A member 6 isoform X1 [Oryzias latipes]|uniref:pleckstrin homology domain-containing family A member 6 isoform X1 n=3 Tax=Oryzias latipes TaxID=8090 RepID=UPI0009DADEDC|nr:pleckstrin homology domain-containing family A member 6 isoform X1 [Oryzias latipes]
MPRDFLPGYVCSLPPPSLLLCSLLPQDLLLVGCAESGLLRGLFWWGGGSVSRHGCISACQHEPGGTAGQELSPIQLQKLSAAAHPDLQDVRLDMNGKVITAAARISHSKSASMVSEDSAGSQSWICLPSTSDVEPPSMKMSRTPKKTATFGKRSNSLRRNPAAVVTKQGWLFKQASSGVKGWNKRWFVLTDRCLFYYKDDKEDTVLGSLPLLSFRIRRVESSDNITRKFAFKVWSEKEEEGDDGELNAAAVSCMQAKHAGTRTYFFSADSHEDQEAWIRAMSEAADVSDPPTQRTKPEPTEEPKQVLEPQIQNSADSEQVPPSKMNGVSSPESTPTNQEEPRCDQGERPVTEAGGDDGAAPSQRAVSNHNPQQRTNPAPVSTNNQSSRNNPTPSRAHSGQQRHPEGGPPHDPKNQQENVVLRRGFLTRAIPEREAQRKSSMAQLQQWVNQRRSGTSQDDVSSPSHYYSTNRGIPMEHYRHSMGSQFLDEYPLYSASLRPESICSVSAVGAYDRHWTLERRSLRDGPPLYRDSWGPQQFAGMEKSMRRLSIQPRSRSVPRSPSLSSGGPYSPVPPNFASPARSPSVHFERFPGKREDVIYADPFSYSLRRSISSPKYVYPGERRSFSQGVYHHNYPMSPSLHMKTEDMLDLQLQRNLDYLDQQVPPFHDIYSRELHPTLKLNEIETSKLLGRLCEQRRMLKDQEALVHRLRMDKDNLEDELVAIHQEMELYHNQPIIMEKLQFKKEAWQNQLINLRGELSQASSALTTMRMEFEALEDEANAIHGDLWEQLNAGGQSELVRRHIQKEFWRVQDVLEGLHKNHSSRGTDTAKHRVASGASGSFSTNSPASPLSSVSLTSPLSPFSPVQGCQASPTKQLGPEESVPPRPPLPKSYYPLEPSLTFPPSVPPLPLDSTAWLHSLGMDESYLDHEDSCIRQARTGEQSSLRDVQDQVQDKQSTNKVGIVPPRTKSPAEETHRSSAEVPRHISKDRPKSAVFPAELRSKMSLEEQNERIRRNMSSSMRDKRRSLNLSAGPLPPNFKVVRRRVTAHEIDIKDLEAAVRDDNQESPWEEIARLRRLQNEGMHDSREMSPQDQPIIPESLLDPENETPLSPEEQKEKQKKLDRIKTLIAKSNLQNVVPVLDGPVEGGASASSQHQLLEQEKRIEITCALAAEASRRSRFLSAQCASSPPMSPSSLVPPHPPVTSLTLHTS